MLKKIKTIIIIFTLIITSVSTCPVTVSAEQDFLKLYANAAVLIDGSNGRILYGKNEDKVLPMASTTKVMTLIIALEYGNLDDIVTISKYASSQPDVQMDAVTGEQYVLKDLLHAMMMQSYNDVAVAIAEYVADVYMNEQQQAEIVSQRTTEDSKEMVKVFAGLMNEKAKKLGCFNTYFITPNGLDAQDENGIHSTTAYELAKICAYAVSIEDVINICTTRKYSFKEINGKRSINIGTTNRFLDMMNGAVGLKTGFTGNAGYCFAGAVKRDGKIFISVVLGSGWPPNKNYKWVDTKALMNYGINNYFYQKIFVPDEDYERIAVNDGVEEYVDTYIPFSLGMLMSENDGIDIVYVTPDYVRAPVDINEEVGKVNIYLNGNLYTSFPILTKKSVPEKDFWWCLKFVLKEWVG